MYIVVFIQLAMAKKSNSLRKKQDYQDRYVIRMQGGKTGLVEATSKMDIHEFRVFMALLTMVLPDDDDFIEYELRTQDILKLYSLSDDGRYYEAIRDASERLFNKKFVIYETKEDGEVYKTTIHLIDETSEPVKESEQSRIRLKFNPKLKPYLLQLQREYLTIDVRNIAKITSPNSVKLYVILKHQYNLGNRKVKYTITRLKEILAISEDEYPLYGNFKQKIIQKGMKDLEKHTDLMVVKLEEEKAGRAVDSIIFFLVEKKAPRQVEILAKPLNRQVIKSSNGNVVVSTHTSERQENIEEIIEGVVVDSKIVYPSVKEDDFKLLYEKVKKYKISKTTLNKWLDDFPLEQINLGIDYVIQKLNEGEKVKNIGGYMNNMVKTTSLIEAKEEQKNSTIIHKTKSQDQQATRQQEAEQEQIRNNLKKAFFQKRVDLINSIIDSENGLTQKILQQLRNENTSDKINFFADLAMSNYKHQNHLIENSEEEFMFNFNAGGTFQSYVLEKMGNLYPREFKTIKDMFIPQAKSIGLKESDLF